jgi:predicted PilT family ATPase
MNEFAKLLSAKQQTSVLLDCCVIVKALQGNPEVLAFRKRIVCRKDVKIIAPSILVREVAKVARIDEEAARAIIESFSETGQIEYISKCGDYEGNNMERQASLLRAKYPHFSHAPDNYYLVLCQKHAAVLVTFDRQMKYIARMEGIMTCSPAGFQLYQ